MQYELFYLIGERQEANLEKIKEKIKEILVSEKANLLEPELNEKRKLAYEIKHQRKGVYVTRRFEFSESGDSKESTDEKNSRIEKITKKLNLFSDVLRFLIVKTSDLPDLEAKERRKAQEMNTQKQSFQRPERQEQQKPKAFKKPEKQEKARPIKIEQKKEIIKEEEKDIDKQLDKLLDI
jgi:ribosomal protein S6